jgi:hypothetical protein
MLLASRATLGPHGGPVDISIAPLPKHCRPDVAASGTWLELVSDDGSTYRFKAAPNTSPLARTGSIVIGDRTFAVAQAGLIRTRLAASPGRLTVGISPKYKKEKRELAIWTDNPSATLAVAPTAAWIRVEAARTRKPGARLFEVIVDSASLSAGNRLEGAIVVSADGAPPLAIPVIVEGISRR